jgi:hypothetical protein
MMVLRAWSPPDNENPLQPMNKRMKGTSSLIRHDEKKPIEPHDSMGFGTKECRDHSTINCWVGEKLEYSLPRVRRAVIE